MAGQIEIERKYEIPDRFTLPNLAKIDAVATVEPPAKLRLDAIYYDTADLRLTRRRVTLRRRHGGHDAGWHIKRPAVAGRSEHQYPTTDGPTVPAQVLADVAAIVRGAALAPIARVRTRRQEQALKDADGAVLALLAIDKVSAERLLPPVIVSQWRELEVELVAGDEALLHEVEAALARAGAVPAASASKLAQAVGDAYPDGPDDGGGSAAGRALWRYMRDQRDALLHNDPLVRTGDPDGVHDMRVATRRLRSTLATFNRTVGGEAARVELKWLADQLGAVRDRDVLVDLIVADATPALPGLIRGPVLQRIRRRVEADQAAARQSLAEAMDGSRYRKLLDQIDVVVDRPAGDVDARYLLRRIGRRLGEADRLMAGAAAPAESIDEVDERDVAAHEARKAFKRARYAVELAVPLAGADAARLVARVKKLQDALGEHHDAVVATVLLAEVADEAYREGSNPFPYGQLSGRQRARADALRATALALHAKTSKTKVRGWLDA